MDFAINEFHDSIVRDMTEGILVIGFDGTILYANDSLFRILDVQKTDMVGKKFAAVFLEDPRNDAFTQTVLDAVYSRKDRDAMIVPYFAEDVQKHLKVAVCLIRDEGKEPIGLTMVVDDLSELMELKDAVKAMEQISMLNRQLEDRNELLSNTFGMFLSDEIVSQLLNTPDGLVPGGRKRTVTVMMSDLRGFTAMSERMDAGDLISMLNHYLGEMTDVIQGRGGTIIEFIGDGILAVFGAPAASATHAADALAAALEMQLAMEEINRWNEERQYPVLEMGIGLNTGEVIVGNIGSQKRMKYGVVGSHVNLCGRIESYTTGGQVLISPAVRKRITAPLTIAGEMTVLPKGAPEEIVITHVTGMGEPYRIYTQEAPDELKAVIPARPVSFHKLAEKHTIKELYRGSIVSAGRESAVLQTQVQLQPFDNLLLDAGGQLTCKVIKQLEEGFLLRYTSVPPGYEEWIGSSSPSRQARISSSVPE